MTVSGFNNQVRDFVSDSSWNIYVWGDFTGNYNRIAIWSWGNFIPLGSGADAGVYSLAVDNVNTLYIGGAFANIGNISRWRFARYMNGTFTGFVDNNLNLINRIPTTLLVAPDVYSRSPLKGWKTIYLWGVLTWPVFNPAWTLAGINPLGSLAYNIDANNISLFPDGLSGDALSGSRWLNGWWVTSNAILYDTWTNSVIFWWSFTNRGNRIARRNGTGFIRLGGGLNSTVSALAYDCNGNLIVGWSFTLASGSTANRIAVWDGTGRSTLGSGFLNGSVTSIATDCMGNIFVWGTFTWDGVRTINRIARWYNNRRYTLGSGANSTVNKIKIFGNMVYMGGLFTGVDNVSSSNFIAGEYCKKMSNGLCVTNDGSEVLDQNGVATIKVSFQNFSWSTLVNPFVNMLWKRQYSWSVAPGSAQNIAIKVKFFKPEMTEVYLK